MPESTHQGRDKSGGPVKTALLASGIAAGSLVLFGAALYAAFWLPYGKPKHPLPRSVEMLPLEYEPVDFTLDADRPRAFGWVDRDEGIVTIPVEDAMNLIVERLPVRDDAEEAVERRKLYNIPTDAGSGRYVVPVEPNE